MRAGQESVGRVLAVGRPRPAAAVFCPRPTSRSCNIWYCFSCLYYLRYHRCFCVTSRQYLCLYYIVLYLFDKKILLLYTISKHGPLAGILFLFLSPVAVSMKCSRVLGKYVPPCQVSLAVHEEQNLLARKVIRYPGSTGSDVRFPSLVEWTGIGHPRPYTDILPTFFVLFNLFIWDSPTHSLVSLSASMHSKHYSLLVQWYLTHSLTFCIYKNGNSNNIQNIKKRCSLVL